MANFQHIPPRAMAIVDHNSNERGDDEPALRQRRRHRLRAAMLATPSETDQTLDLQRIMQDSVQDAIYLFDASSRIVDVNGGACRALGRTRDELLEMRAVDVDPESSDAHWEERWAEVKLAGTATHETFHRRKNLCVYPVEVCTTLMELEGVEYNVAVARDISARTPNDRLRDGEARVFELILSGAPLIEALEAIARTIDDVYPGTVSAILIVEGDGNSFKNIASPGMSKACQEFLEDLPTNLMGGSCVADGAPEEATHIADLAADPHYAEFQEAALAHAIRSRWSTPVFDTAGRPIAKVVLYRHSPGLPGDYAIELMGRAAHLVSVVIERKREENALRDSEERFRRTFFNAATGIAISTTSGRFLAANEAYRQMVGYSEKELFLLDFPALTHPEDRAQDSKFLEELLEGGRESFLFEKRYLTKSGGTLWVRSSVSVQRDPDGTPTAIIGVVEDITQQREAEERLRRSEAMLRMASQLIRVGAWSVEIPSLALTWSEEVCGIHEVPHDYVVVIEEAMGFFAPEHIENVREAFYGCVKGGGPFDVEAQIITAKGRRVWVRAIGEAVQDDQGTVVRVQGALQDISVRQAAERRESVLEERLTRTLESISEGFFALDSNWRFIFLNDEAERVFQRPRADTLGRIIWGELSNSSGFSIETECRRALAENRPVEFETLVTARACWYGVRAYPAQGGLAVYFSDVTEKRRGREALASSELRFLEVAEHITDVFYNLDILTEHMLYVSPAYEKIWGRTCESLYATPSSYRDSIHPDDKPLAAGAFTRHLAGEGTELEYRITRPDGTTRWIQDKAYPILDAKGRVERVVGTARDITLRQQADEAVRASEERFRLLSKATKDAIWDWDLDSGTLWCNEGYEILFGYGRSEIDDTFDAWNARIHSDDHVRIVGDIHAAIGGTNELWTAEYRYLRKDKSFAYVLDRGHVIRDSQGKAVRMIGGMTDLSERKEAETRLAEQAALLDQASDAIMVRDLENRVLYWSRGAQMVYGWSANEALGRSVAAFLYQDPAPLLAATATLLEVGAWSGELQDLTKRGDTVTVFGRWTLLRDRHGNAKSILVINTDVTQRKKLEQQYLRAQRMESIGTLAGGIAHDLNNILSPILMAVDILAEDVQTAEARETLSRLKSNAERGADLIKQVLGFARGVEGKRVPINPIDIVRDVQKIAQDTFPKSIQFDLEYPPGTWRLNADPTQFHQVLMNLCVNARDAMPNGGRLILGMENLSSDEVFSNLRALAEPGPCVAITVQDTGCGIPRKLQEKIFEPFFTTKDLGKGTGLGLSTTFSIVRDSGGCINLYSEPGRGTTFKVYWPAFANEGSDETTAIAQRQLPRGHGELILLVDDEESIREITRTALERFGYRVILACHGAEGVSVFVQHRGKIDVVLTDMSMPIMDGPAMVIALKSIDPTVRIIGSSGLVGNEDYTKVFGPDVQHFVAKPYTSEALLTKLRTVLHGPDSGTGAALENPRAPQAAESGGGGTPGPMLDLRVLADLVGTDPEIIIQFLDAFLVSVAAGGQEISRAMKEENCGRISASAHRLKSAARSVGASALGACYERFETLAASEDRAGLEAYFPILEECIASVVEAIENHKE